MTIRCCFVGFKLQLADNGSFQPWSTWRPASSAGLSAQPLRSVLIRLGEMIDIQSNRSRSSLDRLNHAKFVFSSFAFGC